MKKIGILLLICAAQGMFAADKPVAQHMVRDGAGEKATVVRPAAPAQAGSQSLRRYVLKRNATLQNQQQKANDEAIKQQVLALNAENERAMNKVMSCEQAGKMALKFTAYVALFPCWAPVHCCVAIRDSCCKPCCKCLYESFKPRIWA